MIMVGGTIVKQGIWELARGNITDVSNQQHMDAEAHLQRAYEDGRRLAAMRREQMLEELKDLKSEHDRREKAAAIRRASLSASSGVQG